MVNYKLNHNLANNPLAEGLQKRAAFITMRFSVFNNLFPLPSCFCSP